jgi:hypothetical protein
MKRLIYIALMLTAAITGCKKNERLLYHDIARVQLNDTATINSTFVYEPVTTTKDTVYVQVNTIGKTTNHDREVKLVQVTEKGEPFPAVAGVHYVSMDDPSLKKLMVIKADAVSALIPVVLLRDTSLKSNSYRLRLELTANDQFGLGEVQYRRIAIRFSDHLERFFSWRVDAGQAPAFYTFGKYSTGKHQFMINVLHETIDEAWYQAASSIGALTNYQNLLKSALARFNNDPANIASGKAPLRETDSLNSLAISFP